MKIRLKAVIYAPKNFAKRGSILSPAVLRGFVEIEVTPEIFYNLIIRQKFYIDDLYVVCVERNSDGKIKGITQEGEVIHLESKKCNLLNDTKKEISENIKRLIKEGWELIMTKEQNAPIGYDEDLWPEKTEMA